MNFSFIPNALTLLRFALAAGFPFADDSWRIALLVAALLTEFFDGVIARRLGWESRLGRILDPIADRCLFGAVIVTFLVEERLSWWELGALGARDLLVALGALWIMLHGEGRVLRKMAPRFAGKLTTALQYVALLCVVLGIAAPVWLVGGTCALGLWAAAQYFRDYRRLRRGCPEEPAKRGTGDTE
jgi:phosphatidylglycerophosphate synthase